MHVLKSETRVERNGMHPLLIVPNDEHTTNCVIAATFLLASPPEFSSAASQIDQLEGAPIVSRPLLPVGMYVRLPSSSELACWLINRSIHRRSVTPALHLLLLSDPIFVWITGAAYVTYRVKESELADIHTFQFLWSRLHRTTNRRNSMVIG